MKYFVKTVGVNPKTKYYRNWYPVLKKEDKEKDNINTLKQ